MHSINLRFKMRKFVQYLQFKIRNLIFKGLALNCTTFDCINAPVVNGNIYAMRKHTR